MLSVECQRPVFKFISLTLLFSFGLFLVSCSTQAKENHVKRGEEYLLKRKFHEASMEFRAAIDIDDGSAAAHWGLARSYESLGQFPQTVEELRRAVGLAPENLDAKVKLGNYLLAFSPPQFDETERILKDVFSRDTNFIEGHILKASLLSTQGKSEKEVLEVLNHAISLDPNRPESYASLSRFYLKINKIAEAEEALKKGISMKPSAAIGYLEYARFLTYGERFPESETQLLKAVEVEPKNIEALDSLAVHYVSQKQFDKAEKAYKDLVQVEENSPESRVALGNFYVSINRDNEAVEIFSGIVNEFPEYVKARYSLGDIYLDRKETEKVKEQIDALLAINDRDYDALIIRVRLSLRENRAEDAVKDLEEILKNKPDRKDALFYMTQAQIELGHVEQARAFIGDLFKFHPNFLRANLLKIQASLSAGESELALRQSNELIQALDAANPDFDNSEDSITDLKIRALSARGLANLQLGKIAIAQKDLNVVANYSPNSASALVNLAKIHVAERNFAEALKLYEKALAIDSGDFEALSGAVNVLMRENQTALAHSKIDKAISENGNFNFVLSALHYLKADVFTSEKNLEAAETELKTTIGLDENYLPAYSAYATLLIAKNQTDAAIEQFAKVVEKKPSASVYTLIGILEDSRSNAPEAEKNYRKALEIEPESPIAANNLAWMLASDKSSLDEALKLAQASVTHDPNNAGYYDTLGFVYQQKGLYPSAIENFQKAVSLDAADSNRNGVSPNAEYKQRLTLAINSVGKPSA